MSTSSLLSLKQDTLQYDDGRIRADLLISEANALIGMKRQRIRIEVSAEVDREENPDEWLVRRFTYPDVIAATVEATIEVAIAESVDGETAWELLPSPISVAVLLELPETFVAQWEDKVYHLNPHWLPTRPDQEASKKVSGSTGD